VLVRSLVKIKIFFSLPEFLSSLNSNSEFVHFWNSNPRLKFPFVIIVVIVLSQGLDT
jgi:hypothetical protein